MAFIGSAAFFSLPHFVWYSLCAAVRPTAPYWHVGLGSATVALGFVALMSYYSHDPSGLPYQWFIYWPLVGLSHVFVAAAWLFAGRPRIPPNPRLNADRLRRPR